MFGLSINNALYLQIVIVLFTLIILYQLWRLLQIGRRPKDFPPGPPTIPILGNIHLIPAENVHLQFQKWAQEYGPIYSLMLGSKTILVLSSDQAIKELLDRRSAIYSDRMDLYMGQTLLSGGMRILMMRYGQEWRLIRRILHKLLNIHHAKSFEPYQLLENRQMIYDMLRDPTNFRNHVRRYAYSLTTATTFGFRTPSFEDVHLQTLFKIFGEFSILAQTGTAALLDYLPALRSLPSWLLPPKRHAKALHVREKALYRFHWDNVKRGALSSTHRTMTSFGAGLVQQQAVHGFSDDQASYITGTLLEAGSDTTSNTLLGFICAMLCFPDVQARAHEELDRIVGADRMPTAEDAHKMPYIRGCVKESLRWMPTTILGAVPHALIKDDYYMGYRLPKGAGILNNVYSVHNDPERYPDPSRFAPERFIDDSQSAFDAALNPDVSKRDHFTFGAGRRICPGMHVAEHSLFLGISRMLWTFTFKCPRDNTGREIVPDRRNITQGFVASPLPFRALIEPRDEGRAKIVSTEWNSAIDQYLDPRTYQWKKSPTELIVSPYDDKE